MKNNSATFFSIFYLLSFVVFCKGRNPEGNGTQKLEHGKVKLFVFGDSYADTGNLPKLISKSWKTPYGMVFPGQPSGRFSDGRVLTDFIASFLGIESPVTYVIQKSNPQPVKSGSNFAHAGSGVFNTIFLTPNMTVQIDFFQQLLNQNAITSEDLSSSIALVSLAGNDYTTFLIKHGFSFQEMPKFVTSVINQLITNVRRIKELGITKIAITGVPPSGCVPRVTALKFYQSCDENTNQYSQLHNTLLNQNLRALNKAGGDASAFMYIDIYNAFNAALNPANQPAGSLANKLKPCCIGRHGEECGFVYLNGKKAYEVCPDPKASFFWDGEHPSDAGWQAVYSNLENTSLKALLQ